MSSAEKDTTNIWTQIHAINSRITTYTNAKTTVESVKRTCSMQKQNWETSFQALKKNSELSKVKKKDVFEGEMANSLSKRVSKIMSDIQAGITKAGQLETALNNQINRLNTKIQQLQNEKQSWMNQL